MADPSEQKSNIKAKTGGKTKTSLNKLLVIMNIMVTLFIVYQIVEFIGIYSQKNELMFANGRMMNLDPKSNKLELTDISDQELQQKRNEAHIKEHLEKTSKGEKQELVGPAQKETAPEDMVGPIPEDTGQQKQETKSGSGASAPTDYQSANLAVIVTEMGPIKEAYELARTLPKEVAFAFSPYSSELQQKIDATTKEGRTPLLNIMMQPTSFPMKDSGPLSIQVNYDENQNISRFEKTAKMAGGYIGMLSSSDEMVTSKFDKLAPILKKFSERSLFFGYYKNNNNLNLDNDAKPLAADIFDIDYLVDADPSPTEMGAVLNQVKEDIVVKNKKVVIAIRAYPNSINIIKKWLNDNIGNNIQIAPINYFVTNN